MITVNRNHKYKDDKMTVNRNHKYNEDKMTVNRNHKYNEDKCDIHTHGTQTKFKRSKQKLSISNICTQLNSSKQIYLHIIYADDATSIVGQIK